MPVIQSPQSRKPAFLVLALFAAGFVALSIHVAMLRAGVPFPLPEPPAWARWLHKSIVVGGLLAFLSLADHRIGHRSFAYRVLTTFVVTAATQETLRVAIMTGVVTGGWAFSAINLIRPVVDGMIIAVVSVAAARWARSFPSILGMALIGGAVAWGVQQLAGLVLKPFVQSFASLARGDQYQFPYPFHVTVAAYLTFIEAVVGVTLMTLLVWPRLPASRGLRVLTLAVLAALIKGVVGGTFLYGFFTGPSVLIGMFSWSQFLLEFIALGALIGLAWEAFGARADR